MWEIIRKGIGAAILIALGDFALLKLGNPIGPIIFAFGLLGVCYMGQNLFTGKCGFLFQDKIKVSHLFIILAANLVAGYLIGACFSLIDEGVKSAAIAKVSTWTFDLPMLIKSIMCGVIMYIAVLLYKKGTPLGIIFGIPLFIFCGFQENGCDLFIAFFFGNGSKVGVLVACLGFACKGGHKIFFRFAAFKIHNALLLSVG